MPAMAGAGSRAGARRRATTSTGRARAALEPRAGRGPGSARGGRASSRRGHQPAADVAGGAGHQDPERRDVHHFTVKAQSSRRRVLDVGIRKWIARTGVGTSRPPILNFPAGILVLTVYPATRESFYFPLEDFMRSNRTRWTAVAVLVLAVDLPGPGPGPRPPRPGSSGSPTSRVTGWCSPTPATSGRSARAGGVAARHLTTHAGLERFPKLSPDGKSVAFTAEYDGNIDVYVVPADGGEPVRLTWHPDAGPGRRLGTRRRIDPVLGRGGPRSMRRFDRFFKVAARGGGPASLPLPTGGYALASADGRRIAYTPLPRRQPHLEALPRRHGPGHLDLRLQEEQGREDDRLGRGRTCSRCGTATRSTTSPTATAAHQHLGLRPRADKHRQVTRLREYDVKWPSPRHGRHRLSKTAAACTC